MAQRRSLDSGSHKYRVCELTSNLLQSCVFPSNLLENIDYCIPKRLFCMCLLEVFLHCDM